jgi:hypothetical protein
MRIERMVLVGGILVASIAGAGVAQRGGGGARDTVRVPATPPRWGNAERVLTKVFSVGQLDGPPEYAFGSIDGIAVDAKGRFYLFDDKDTQIRQYDASGKFLRPIGKKGKGPGEYSINGGMAVVADTLLGLYDPGSARITLFYPDGKVVRTILEPRATNWGDDSFFGDVRGRSYVRVPVLRPGAAMEEMEMPGVMRGSRYLGFDTRGTLVDSIDFAPLPLRKTPPRGYYLMLPEGSQSNFLPEATSAASPLGTIVQGTGESMRFVIVPPTGAVLVVERPWTPVPVGREESANWKAWSDYFNQRDRGEKYPYAIPATKPAYKSIDVDLDGRIWVSVYTAAEKRDIPPRAAGDKRPLLVWRQRATYDVYDPGGVYLGRVVLPWLTGMIEARGDNVWVMGKGPDDEQIITVYRMGPPR